MIVHPNTKSKFEIIRDIIKTVLGLVLIYFIFATVIDISFGIKLPQLISENQPYSTILSDPHADKPYTIDVNPKTIQKLLNDHSYSENYKVGVFDCSNMSQYVAQYLSEAGYHASVIGDDNNEHAWVMVWNTKNTGWAIESTSVSEFKNNTGEVVGDDWYDFHFVWGKIVNDNVYEFYYPTVDRGGLYVLDWDDPEVDKR